MRVLKLSVLFAGLLQAAGFDTRPWKYVAPVRVPESGRLCVIPFDRTLYARMRQDLADLRIVKNDEEIPYAIETLAGSVEERECHAPVLNKAVIPDSGSTLSGPKITLPAVISPINAISTSPNGYSCLVPFASSQTFVPTGSTPILLSSRAGTIESVAPVSTRKSAW